MFERAPADGASGLSERLGLMLVITKAVVWPTTDP